jgi:LysR family hca operon transcriptional activator
MELLDRRRCVAAAEAGSLKVAAQRKLYAPQTSLSRQIRVLKEEVGAQRLTRGARGIERTRRGAI